MGVPVVTLIGETHVSRVGASILSRIGQPQWIASSKNQYIAIARQLARELSALKTLRASLRSAMASCSLLDVKAITSDLEHAFRKMVEDRTDHLV